MQMHVMFMTRINVMYIIQHLMQYRRHVEEMFEKFIVEISHKTVWTMSK